MFLLWAGLTIALFHSAHWAQAQVLGIWGLRAFGTVSSDLVTYRSSSTSHPALARFLGPPDPGYKIKPPPYFSLFPAALWKEALWRSQKE